MRLHRPQAGDGGGNALLRNLSDHFAGSLLRTRRPTQPFYRWQWEFWNRDTF